MVEALIEEHAHDIINDEKYLKQKEYMQHGDISVYDHQLMVTKTSIKIAKKLRIKVNYESLIRGSLLHDYFLYDWHEKDSSHKLHGFRHAKSAMNNADRDFKLNHIEKNMIKCHMFPLNLRVPRYKESIILCIADKICATKETIDGKVKILYKRY